MFREVVGGRRRAERPNGGYGSSLALTTTCRRVSRLIEARAPWTARRAWIYAIAAFEPSPTFWLIINGHGDLRDKTRGVEMEIGFRQETVPSGSVLDR